MARVLNFTQVPETLHGRDRDYTKDLPLDSSAIPTEATLYSGDFLNARYEEIAIGVQFREPGQIWGDGSSVLEDSFLTWFTQNGGEPQLAEAIKHLEEADQKDRIRKSLMREKGYSLVAQIIQQAEKLGYFEHLRRNLVDRYERGKAFSAEWLPKFLAEFPEFSLVYDRFFEEKKIYAARPAQRRGRMSAMMVSIHPIWNTVDEGGIGFELGTMRVDDNGGWSRFHRLDNHRLPSTGEYPLTWFRGKMEESVRLAIASRKQILTELGK